MTETSSLTNIIRPPHDSTNELSNDQQIQLVITCRCIIDLFKPVVDARMEMTPVEDAFEYYEGLFAHLELLLNRSMQPIGWAAVYSAIIDERSEMSKEDKLRWIQASSFVPEGDKTLCRIVCNSFDFD